MLFSRKKAPGNDRSGGSVMDAKMKLTGLLMAGLVCLPLAVRADTQTPHHTHKVKKQTPPPPPLPSGPQGPVPQIPLDAIPAVAPEVSFQDGLLTIIAPNSTLADILRNVRKQTSADIEIPASASERVVTRLGPAPAREVMAELLNGSHFNYILLGSPEDANALTRVVLVAKTPDTPTAPSQAGNNPPPQPAAAAAADDAAATDDTAAEEDQSAAVDPEPPPANPDQPGVKTPQQMLQEMQQRQLQMQQQPGAQGVNPPPPPGAGPGRPFQQQQPPPDQQ
jgi:hypothetical protein